MLIVTHQDLKNAVLEKNSELNVQTRVYPKYETRGDLAACVETFREWLQDQVTDLERDAATPSAILDPSVSVILVAHSMGYVFLHNFKSCTNKISEVSLQQTHSSRFLTKHPSPQTPNKSSCSRSSKASWPSTRPTTGSRAPCSPTAPSRNTKTSPRCGTCSPASRPLCPHS